MGRGDVSAIRRALRGWYAREQRVLPWRESRDPYRIWVSEVMLQQTTVRAVVPYYEAFLQRFPDVHALAAAREEDVLAAWSGLGYYHRARNLRRGAQHVVEHHGGRFPRTSEEAQDVPGIGRYTAAAVLSIAYGVPLAVVDGNVRRVLARLRGLRGDAYRTDDGYYAVAEELLDRAAPGDWNQAVMELGATVCTPKQPRCEACPLAAHCHARAAGTVSDLPEKRPRRAPVDVTVAAALVEERGRILLVRRPGGRLMGGMWEVPQTGLESDGLRDLVRELRERHGLHVRTSAVVALARHAITFRRIRVEGYRATLVRRPADDDRERFRWVDPLAPGDVAMSSLSRKLLLAAARGQRSLDLEDRCAP